MSPNILPEELEAFHIIRNLLSGTVAPDRIFYGHVKSYFSINLDDNNFRPICRLYLKKDKKLIGTICDKKVETRHEINTVEDIVHFAPHLIAKVRQYQDRIT